MPGTPNISPLFPDPPIDYQDSELAIALYNLPEPRLRALLPPEVRPGGLGACLAVFARYPKTTIGPYREVVVLVSAEYAGETGFFCPFIYVTTDAAMAAGREVWGFPKKIAEIDLRREGDAVHASLARAGATAELSATLSGPPDPLMLDALSGAPIFNQKRIPSVAGKEPDVNVITATVLEIAPKEALAGTGRIGFAGGPEDAWDLLAPEKGAEVAAFWMVADAVLPAGRIVGAVR